MDCLVRMCKYLFPHLKNFVIKKKGTLPMNLDKMPFSEFFN